MKSTSKALVFTSLLAFAAVPALAADTKDTAAPSDATVAASKAGTEIEKAVGAGDTFTRAELESRITLDEVPNPAQTLASAKVDDFAGNIIGPVKNVVMDNKEVDAIHVDVGGWLGIGARTVSLDADEFTYIPSRNILITSLTKNQVKKLPAID